MIKRFHAGCMLLAMFILAIIVALWGLWYCYPLSNNEKQQSQTLLVTETRYIVADDTTALFSFSAIQGDTLLRDIHNLNDSANWRNDTIEAQWVRRWDMVPYNGDNLVILAQDTNRVCRLKHNDIITLLHQEEKAIKQGQDVVRQQRKDVEYFLRTHTVLDNGFDIVARYGKRLTAYSKTLEQASATVQKGLKGKALTIRMERRYFLLHDSTGHRTECKPRYTANGLLNLTATTQCEGPTLTERLSRKSSAPAILKKRHAMRPKPIRTWIDSIGEYKGARDSAAIPHGYGCLQAKTGDYYEGEWVHGKRNGVGFSIIPGKRLRLGEWKEDRFLGERIAYTPERIYGIDISRHQHEKGRKRFSINWKNLRIVSLGKMSKKVIHGKVDYPVRFIFIKATEGTTIRNKYFVGDYLAARKHGYKTGAYHFFSVRTSGRQQANNFLRNSRYAKGDLPPVLDLEPTDKQIKQAGGIRALFNNVRQWLNTVERQRGRRPILYISQRFVNKYLSLAPDLHNNYDVWIARYGEYKPDVNLVYWQLSPDGRVSGIHGDVDINVYNGFDF